MAATETSLPPRLSFSLPLDPARLLRARQRVRDFLHEQVADGDAIEAVVLAIEEAMTNAVRHSGAHDDLDVLLYFEGDDLVAEIKDRGSGFDLTSFDPHRLPDLMEPSGRGLYLIAQLMDELELRCDGGLEVRVVKRGVRRDEPAGGPRGPDLQAAVPGAQDYRNTRQRALLEEIDESFIALDWDYRYLHLNEAGLRLQGSTAEELLGRRVWDVRPGLRDTPLGAALREATELGHFAVVEYVSDVTGEWLEARVYPTSSGVSVFARGIGERKRREAERDELLAALRASDERYAAIFASAPFAVSLSRMPEVTLVDVNRAFLELFELERDEAIGKTSTELGIADERSRERVAAELAATGRARGHEVERTTKSGARLVLSLNVDWVTIAGQRYLLTTVMNVTEQKLAEESLAVGNEELAAALEELRVTEEELRAQNDELAFSRQALLESDERFRLALRNAPVSVSAQDRDLRYVWAYNQRSATPEQIIGKRDGDLFTAAEAERLMAIKRHVLEHDIEVHEEMWLERPQGRMYLSVNFEPLHDAAGRVTGVGVATVDLTDMKLAEEALAASRARLAATLEAQELIAADRDELLRRSEHELAATRLLARAAALASSSLGLEEVAEKVLAGIRDDLGDLQAGSVYALEPDGARLRHLALFGYPAEILSSIGELTLDDESNVGRVALGRQVLTHETPDEPAGTLQRRHQMGLEDSRWIAVPIERGDELVGVMALFFTGRRSFGDDEVRLYRGVAAILGNAIANARLFEREVARGEAEAERATRTEALHALAQAAAGSLDVAEVARLVVDELGRLFPIVLATVFVADEARGELVRQASYGDPVEALASALPFALDSDAETARVYRGGEPIVVEGTAPGAGSPSPAGRAGAAARSYLILPLAAYGRAVGALQVVWPAPRRFSDDDLAFYTAVAQEVAVSLENARLHERQQHIAGTLQEHFLHALPTIAGLELATLSTPAYQPELIGGDFHDVFESPAGPVYALIGDVMGKGVTAAGLTETVRSSVRALALAGAAPEAILADLNLLIQREEHEQFVSALLLRFDPGTRRGRLASGGHPPAIRLSADGALPLEARGPLLGTFEDRFATVDFGLDPGDALVLYTDGITEARRAGELFGERRLREVVGGLYGKGAPAIAEAVRAAALDFAGVLRDDFEILVLRV